MLEDHSASTTLYPTSSLLLLAHIRFTSNTTPTHSHRRQNSDDLMQDLESTLGLGSSTTPYLTVRLTYHHSAFPDQQGSTSCTTRLETTSTASIKRRNTRSPWSPPPPRQRQKHRQRQPLSAIVAAHWGAEAASDVARRITSPGPPSRTPPLPAASFARTMGPGRTRGGGGFPPVVPRRRASLRRGWFAETGEIGGQGETGEEEEEEEEEEREHDRARKIWTEIRRMSSVGGEGERRVSGATAIGEKRVGRSEVERRREVIREKALRNRRSVGADTLKSLVPTEAGSGDRETTPKKAAPPSKVETALNGRGKGKENMRWSWTGWWQ